MIIRGIIEDYYDIQKMRIEMEGQLRSHSQGVSEQEEIWFKENVLAKMQELEKVIAKRVKDFAQEDDIYNEWLVDIKGVGPILSVGLISWIGDIERFATISKLWAYAGLHVTPEGRAVKRKRGQQSNWNSRLKTHCWKIGESFVKQKADKSGYRTLYDTFRKEYDDKWVTGDDCGSDTCKKNKNECYKMHRYMAAKRKVVKVFLAHYWMKSRELKGLPIEHPFIMGREGHSHLIEVIEQ